MALQDRLRRRGSPEQRVMPRAILLALSVHLLLFAMLFIGINWQTRDKVQVVQAELWTPPPQP
ncbi:MAG TPA: protein TolA, partial [Burkholderiaceae bacterium]|nr:protein TolA [Burkholderiaceae bacterium]